MKTIGVDNILYAVDYTYLKYGGPREFLKNANISADDKEEIAHGNAEIIKILDIKNIKEGINKTTSHN